MTAAPRPSREIDGKGRTVRDLLAGRKYSIDNYQREYKSQQKRFTMRICNPERLTQDAAS